MNRCTKKYSSFTSVAKLSAALYAIHVLFKDSLLKKRSVVVVTQSGGEYGIDVVDFALREAFPDRKIQYFSSNEYKKDIHGTYDLIIESCPTFQGADDVPCRFSGAPWVQFSGEALVSYAGRTWCQHTEPPIVRFDTSMKNEKSVYGSPLQIWVPYACVYVLNKRDKFLERTVDEQAFLARPYFLAWASSNCQEFRLKLWQAIRTAAMSRNLTGIHSVGTCAHDHDVVSTTFWSNDELYSRYKFVLVAENTLEIGYVTEKIATVLAAGAIPIYFGDSKAAKLIFNPESFIDVAELFDEHQVDMDSPQAELLNLVAEQIIQTALNKSRVQELLKRSMLLQPQYDPTSHTYRHYPPTCYETVPAAPQLTSHSSLLTRRLREKLAR